MSLVAVGATMPAWSKSLARDPYALTRAYRAHRHLRPLWSVLREAVPGIALNQPARNMEFRLYRRDEKGRIVKERDHLMDATRYLEMTGISLMRCAPAPVKPTGPPRRSGGTWS